LHVGNLTHVIAVGALDFNGGTELGGSFYKIVTVTLPAFFLQGIQGKSDERAGSLGAGNRPCPGSRQNDTCDNANQTRDNDKGKAQFHPINGGGKDDKETN
jgi:hypothetical protein